MKQHQVPPLRRQRLSTPPQKHPQTFNTRIGMPWLRTQPHHPVDPSVEPHSATPRQAEGDPYTYLVIAQLSGELRVKESTVTTLLAEAQARERKVRQLERQLNQEKGTVLALQTAQDAVLKELQSSIWAEALEEVEEHAGVEEAAQDVVAEEAALEKALTRAKRKFDKLDAQGSGVLEVGQALALVEWLWRRGLRPGGRALVSAAEQAVQAERLTREAEQGMRFEALSAWFRAAYQRVKHARAQAAQHSAAAAAAAGETGAQHSGVAAAVDEAADSTGGGGGECEVLRAEVHALKAALRTASEGLYSAEGALVRSMQQQRRVRELHAQRGEETEACRAMRDELEAVAAELHRLESAVVGEPEQVCCCCVWCVMGGAQ